MDASDVYEAPSVTNDPRTVTFPRIALLDVRIPTYALALTIRSWVVRTLATLTVTAGSLNRTLAWLKFVLPETFNTFNVVMLFDIKFLEKTVFATYTKTFGDVNDAESFGPVINNVPETTLLEVNLCDMDALPDTERSVASVPEITTDQLLRNTLPSSLT